MTMLEGRIAYCLATGPSVLTHALDRSLDRVPAERLIAIGRAITLRNDAAFCLLDGDDGVLQELFPILHQHVGVKFCAAGAKTFGLEMQEYIADYEDTLSVVPGTLAGVQAGQYAVNLALQLGARKVVLLGYDGGPADGRAHFYGDSASEDNDHDRRNADMDNVARLLPTRFPGTEIVNCSPVSRLTGFRYQSLLDVLDEDAG